VNVTEVFGYFTDLQLYDRGVDVAVTMIFSKHGGRLFGAVFHNKPSWRLGKEENENHDDARETTLDESRGTPGPGRVWHVQIRAILEPRSIYQ